MMNPKQFPDMDEEVGGYRACIVGDSTELPRIEFHGLHHAFAAARDRAKRIHAALVSAGETGIKAHVHWHGDRPDGFPRNGITL
jgi:hypothetical protein